MSVQKKSLISSRAVATKGSESSDNSTSMGESKPLQARTLMTRNLKTHTKSIRVLKKKKQF